MKKYEFIFGFIIIISIFLIFTNCSKKENIEFVSIFDGKTLNGWRIPEGDNGHWRIIDGIIDYDGKSEALGEDKNLWTEKEYGDFILKIDWRLPRTPIEKELP